MSPTSWNNLSVPNVDETQCTHLGWPWRLGMGGTKRQFCIYTFHSTHDPQKEGEGGWVRWSPELKSLIPFRFYKTGNIYMRKSRYICPRAECLFQLPLGHKQITHKLSGLKHHLLALVLSFVESGLWRGHNGDRLSLYHTVWGFSWKPCRQRLEIRWRLVCLFSWQWMLAVSQNICV